jgi:hypothetical protein
LQSYHKVFWFLDNVKAYLGIISICQSVTWFLEKNFHINVRSKSVTNMKGKAGAVDIEVLEPSQEEQMHHLSSLTL